MSMKDAENLLSRSQDLSHWIEALQAPNPTTRREAAEVLGEIGDERALYPLICALQDDNQGVQQAAMDALARIGGEFTVYCLLPLLRDDRPDLRNMAREILQRIGGSGIHLLCRALRDRDPDVRRMVADILAALRNPESVEALINALKDPNPNVRASVAAALGEIGDPRAVEPLMECLRDHPWVAFFAVRALGRIGDSRAVPPLLELLRKRVEDEDQEMLQLGALEALGALGPQDHLQDLVDLWKHLPDSIRPVAARILVQTWKGDLSTLRDLVDPVQFGQDLLKTYHEADPDTGLILIQALACFQVPGATRAILELADQMELEDPEPLEKIEKALVTLGETESLLAALSDGTEIMKRLALRALGTLRAQEAVPDLIRVYQEAEDPLLQAELLKTLGQIGTSRGLDVLQQALHHEIPLIRKAAAEALAYLPGSQGEEALWTQLEQEDQRDVAYALVATLIRKSPSATTRLMALMDHSHPLLREVAAWGLGQLQDPEARAVLLQGVSDPEWRVRRRCVEALAQDTAPETLEGLLMATCDDREEVRISAVRGLWERWRKDRAMEDAQRKAILEALIATLRDDHIRVRCQALEVMGRIRDPQVIPVLLEAVQRERGPSQVMAIEVLGWLKAQEAVPLLESLTGDPNPYLREVARKALEQIQS